MLDDINIRYDRRQCYQAYTSAGNAILSLVSYYAYDWQPNVLNQKVDQYTSASEDAAQGLSSIGTKYAGLGGCERYAVEGDPSGDNMTVSFSLQLFPIFSTSVTFSACFVFK